MDPKAGWSSSPGRGEGIHREEQADPEKPVVGGDRLERELV